MAKEFWVYILTNKPEGTLYIGVTSDLARRVWEHKNKVVEGFTLQYNLDTLVYCEAFDDAEGAIAREKQMKKWKRAWKIRLIEDGNPEWKDLFDEING
jgi:putative endonuclease